MDIINRPPSCTSNVPLMIPISLKDANLCSPELNIDINNIEILKEHRKKDEIFINRFIDKVLSVIPSENVVKNTLPQVKNVVTKIHYLTEKLNKLLLKMTQNYDDENWDKSKQECDNIKSTLQILQNILFDSKLKSHFITQIKRQRKRQMRRKQKKIIWSRKKKYLDLKRVNANWKINEWMNKKEYEIDKEKEENQARKNADRILEDVKSKRSNSKKYLELLQELQNLRRIKTTIANARGEKLCIEAETAFDNVVSELIQPWKVLDKEYALEEKGLKLMIASDLHEDVKKSTKNTFDSWIMALFNDKNYKSRVENMDLDTFKKIRKGWDKYINPEGTEIPIGWVLPSEPSSPAWSKYINKSKI